MKKDILNAIEVEKTYLYHKLRGEKTPSLIDEIQACGFETLEEYFDSKKQYLFKQLNFEIKTITPSQSLFEWNRILRDRVTSAFLLKPENVVVWVNKSKPYNKEYCLKNNLEVYELSSGGGTIVSNKGDLQLAICIPNQLQIGTEFMLNSIKQILKKHINGVEIVGNDILIGERKVFGITSVSQNEMTLFAMHFSLSDNTELINNICHSNSEPVKIPFYITELDLNTLENEVISWLTSI